MQQIEYLFNLTLTVDAKKHRPEEVETLVNAEVTDLAEPMNKLGSGGDDELHAIADSELV